MQSSAPSPPKPWERAGRRPSVASTPSNLSSSPVSSVTPATSSSAALSSSSATSSSRVLSASPASSVAYGSQYGSTYGSGYGSSMYGGRSQFGGMGSSMYGGSMYGGGSSMYGGGSSMYGTGMSGGQSTLQGPQSEWFAPKAHLQPMHQPSEVNKRVLEFTELNTSFLEAVHVYGENLRTFARRLILGLAKLHLAVTTGSLDRSSARQLAVIAIAAFTVVVGAMLRRRRGVALEDARWPFATPRHVGRPRFMSAL